MNISDYTKKDTYSTLRSYLFSHDLSIDVNGVSVAVSDLSRVEKLVYPNSIEPGKKISLDKYCTPSSVVLQTYERIGKEVEKSIQCAFLLQMFNIKGTDILCAAFCFIISLLSCESRNTIYLALRELSAMSSQTVSGARAVNDLANTALSMADIGSDIVNTVSGMFNKNTPNEQSSTGANLTNVEKIATVLAAPANIIQNIKLILKAMQLSKALSFLNGDFIGKTLWEMAANILHIVQCMVIQMVDELLNKLIAPIEEFLKKLTPGICFGTMADAIRQKIMQFIRSLKSKLLSEIADLFQSTSSFNLKFRANQKQCGWSLELLAFIEVINFILQDFVTFATACGVSPCSTTGYTYKPSDIPNQDDDSINPFSFNISDSAIELEKIPDQINNINDLADKISQYTNTPTTVTDNNIQSIYQVIDDAPAYIQSIINNGILNNILDSNYNIVKENNKVNIVYTFNKDCRED